MRTSCLSPSIPLPCPLLALSLVPLGCAAACPLAPPEAPRIVRVGRFGVSLAWLSPAPEGASVTQYCVEKARVGREGGLVHPPPQPPQVEPQRGPRRRITWLREGEQVWGGDVAGAGGGTHHGMRLLPTPRGEEQQVDVDATALTPLPGSEEEAVPVEPQAFGKPVRWMRGRKRRGGDEGEGMAEGLLAARRVTQQNSPPRRLASTATLRVPVHATAAERAWTGWQSDRSSLEAAGMAVVPAGGRSTGHEAGERGEVVEGNAPASGRGNGKEEGEEEGKEEDEWVAALAPVPAVGRHCSVQVPSLRPISCYRFRVAAVSRAGRGAASEPSPVVETKRACAACPSLPYCLRCMPGAPPFRVYAQR